MSKSLGSDPGKRSVKPSTLAYFYRIQSCEALLAIASLYPEALALRIVLYYRILLG